MLLSRTGANPSHQTPFSPRPGGSATVDRIFWESGYSLVFDSGEAMGFSGKQVISEDIPPGEEFDIAIHLVSPTAPGTYTGSYKLADVNGIQFGTGAKSDQPFYVQITVTGQNALVITPSPYAHQAIQGVTHLVSKNDTLQEIAIEYHVDIEDIRIANGMVGDAILARQRLFVPKPGQSLTRIPYQFSSLEGATDTDYPLTLSTDRFTLHYSPETYPATDPQIISRPG